MRVHSKTKNKGIKHATYPCLKCDQPIKAGDKYYEWQHRHAKPSRQHQSHGAPRQSELCAGKMSGVYGAVEGAEDGIVAARKAGDISGLAEILNTCAEEVENVRQEYEDSRSNMPDHLQDCGTGAEMEEKMNELETFKDSLENAASECETFASELDDLEAEHEAPPDEHAGDCPVYAVENGDATEGTCECDKEDKETASEENETEQSNKLDEAFECAENVLQELSI